MLPLIIHLSSSNSAALVIFFLYKNEKQILLENYFYSLNKCNFDVLTLIKTVDSFATRQNLPVLTNRCPVDKHTTREEVKQLVYDLTAKYPDLKERIFGAMQRFPLPEWQPKGRYKRPKDES